jgi:hypothetical protein
MAKEDTPAPKRGPTPGKGTGGHKKVASTGVVKGTTSRVGEGRWRDRFDKDPKKRNNGK